MASCLGALNYILYACAPLIDGLGHVTRSATKLMLAIYLSQACCIIISVFRAAMDFDTMSYPLSNLIRPRCAERAKPG